MADEIPQFTFQRERAASGFAAAADGVAVVADAVLEQEIAIRVRGGQALGGAAVGDQETAG